MWLRIVLFVAALATLAGCSVGVPLPPDPTSRDTDELLTMQLDAVWDDTGLDDSLRPEIQPERATDSALLGPTFARCMMDRGWTAYFADETSANWRAMSEARSDEERLDWYACYASLPMSDVGGLGSVARYDFVYDYYQQTLIPCLEGHGFHVFQAPSRNEFRTRTGIDGMFFVPFVWNPYYAVPDFSATGSLRVAEECPPQPPRQDFYAFN